MEFDGRQPCSCGPVAKFFGLLSEPRVSAAEHNFWLCSPRRGGRSRPNAPSTRSIRCSSQLRYRYRRSAKSHCCGGESQSAARLRRGQPRRLFRPRPTSEDLADARSNRYRDWLDEVRTAARAAATSAENALAALLAINSYDARTSSTSSRATSLVSDMKDRATKATRAYRPYTTGT